MAHGNCDSFFVQSDEPDFHSRQAEAREKARAFARERQRSIAEELSRQVQDEYQDDILDTMELMESKTLPDVNSIDIQTEIQWFMRSYLLDFLIEAHAAFRLLPETLYLAVNLLDRYCSKRVVYKRHYQLVGCAALLIAAKYGDKKDHVPRICELRSMCCGLYEDEMFTQMEWHVLQTLDWLIGHPTIDGFLQLIMSEEPFDAELEHMTSYICEIALFHREFVSTPPSVLARSALALARYVLSRPLPTHAEWSARYDYNVLVKLSETVYLRSPVLLKKYGSAQFSFVSHTMEAFLERSRLESQQSAQSSSSVSACAMEGQHAEHEAHALPHTPQKGPYPGDVQTGLATPPITPENDVAYAAMYAKQGHIPPRCPATPTPPSSAEHINQYQYGYGYAPIHPNPPQYYLP